MKTIILVFLLSVMAFGQSGKSNLTQQQKDSIVALIGGQVVDASLSGYETLANAITTISTDKKTLIIKDTQDLATNIPSNITLKFTNDGMINFTSVCTLRCQIQDIDKEIFTGTTPIIYDNIINPLWFGAKRDNSEDSQPAIQKALNSLSHGQGGVVSIPSGFYRLNNTLTIPYGTGGGIVVEGNNKPIGGYTRYYNFDSTSNIDKGRTVLAMCTSDTLMYIYQNGGFKIENLDIINMSPDTSAPYALYFEDADQITIRNVNITGFYKGTAIYFNGGVSGMPHANICVIAEIDNCTLQNNYVGVDYQGQLTGLYMHNSRVIANDTAYPILLGSIGIRIHQSSTIEQVYFDYCDTAVVIGGDGRAASDRECTANTISNCNFDGSNVAILFDYDAHDNLVTECYLGADNYVIVDRNSSIYPNYISNNMAFDGTTASYDFSVAITKPIITRQQKSGLQIMANGIQDNLLTLGRKGLSVDDDITSDSTIYAKSLNADSIITNGQYIAKDAFLYIGQEENDISLSMGVNINSVPSGDTVEVTITFLNANDWNILYSEQIIRSVRDANNQQQCGQKLTIAQGHRGGNSSLRTLGNDTLYTYTITPPTVEWHSSGVSTYVYWIINSDANTVSYLIQAFNNMNIKSIEAIKL